MLGTMPTKAVARELLRRPTETRWSREMSFAIKANTGNDIRRGTVGRILSQMETEGWLTGWYESRDDCRTRLPRHYFTITDDGLSELHKFLGIEQEEDEPLIAVGQ